MVLPETPRLPQGQSSRHFRESSLERRQDRCRAATLRPVPQPVHLGWGGAGQYNQRFANQASIRNRFSSCEGVLIFPVKSNHAPFLTNDHPQAYAAGSLGHPRIQGRKSLRSGRPHLGIARLLAILVFVLAATSALAQTLTVEQIRVIGNRRIPKETILARLFTLM